MSVTISTYEDDYEHPIVAIRRDSGIRVFVRRMVEGEMPDDGIIYYVDTDCTIYEEDELEVETESD